MKHGIAPAIAALILMGACASSPVTSAAGVPIVNPIPDGKMAKQWDKAAKDIRSGEKLIAGGQKDIDRGEKLIRTGRKDIRKGEDLVEDGKADLNKGERKIAEAKARQAEIEAASSASSQSDGAEKAAESLTGL